MTCTCGLDDTLPGPLHQPECPCSRWLPVAERPVKPPVNLHPPHLWSYDLDACVRCGITAADIATRGYVGVCRVS